MYAGIKLHNFVASLVTLPLKTQGQMFKFLYKKINKFKKSYEYTFLENMKMIEQYWFSGKNEIFSYLIPDVKGNNLCNAESWKVDDVCKNT